MAFLHDLSKTDPITMSKKEEEPNLYVAKVMTAILFMTAIMLALNEFGIFELDKTGVRSCVIVTATMYAAIQIIVNNKRWATDSGSKYIIMFIVLLMILILTVLLNIHVVLACVIPIFLATQYNSKRLSLFTLFGTAVICVASPIISYMAGTWDKNFMLHLVETFCHTTITMYDGNSNLFWDDIRGIIIFWSFPQLIILMGFGVILIAVTNNSIKAYKQEEENLRLTSRLHSQMASLIDMQSKMLCSMSDVIESRDPQTGGHVKRTSSVVEILMTEMMNDPDSGVSREFCAKVTQAAPLHDIGKIAIPDSILKKPGRLSTEEYDIIKTHTSESVNIIKRTLSGINDTEMLTIATNMAKYHHERMDGSGYPEQLAGDKIPLESKIMAIVDVYDALVSQRYYKEAMNFEEAFKTIEDDMGDKFDPKLNKYFIRCRSKIEKYYVESGEVQL